MITIDLTSSKGYNTESLQTIKITLDFIGAFMKTKRTAVDKLNTLLFGKDLRITKGDRYTEEREYDYTSYFPVENYIHPAEIPTENAYFITDFGAIANNTSVNNADAINECINHCHKNGGGYVVVCGGNFTSKTVELKSNVTLFVASDSSIIAHESGEGFEHKTLIFAKDCENIEITGGGTINGNGHFFGRKPLLDKNLTEPADIIDVIQMRRDYRAQLRFTHPSKYGKLCLLEGCKKIHVHNIIFKDSASWTLRTTRCDDILIEDFVINNNRHVCNSDGIDLMQSSNVEIRHCFLSCADDGIVLKNAIWEGCDGAMQNIHVTDCDVISCTNAFKIGTETTYPISKVLVEDCRFYMTDLYPGSVSGISIESVDGADVYDITVKNIEMNRCTCPVFIRLGNRNRAALVNEQSATAIEYGVKAIGGGVDKTSFNMTGKMHDITIENIKAKDIELPVIIAGFKQKGKVKTVDNVTLRNFSLTYRNAKEIIDKRMFIPEYSKEYPECWRFRNLPAYAVWARHVRNLKIESFNCSPAPDTWKKDMIFVDVK